MAYWEYVTAVCNTGDTLAIELKDSTSCVCAVLKRSSRKIGGDIVSKELYNQRLAEAWALIRKGDQFGIGRRFLKTNSVI